MSKKHSVKEYLARMGEDLDRANNFIDYFLVCGVKPTLCLNTALYDDDVTAQKKLVLKPEIISKCPPIDKTLVNIDDGILDYCCPKNFEIIEALTQPDDTMFSFILDNNFFSIEYPQKYVTCLRFYEPVSSYKKLYEKMNNDLRRSSKSVGVSSFVNKATLKRQRSINEELQNTLYPNNDNGRLRRMGVKQVHSDKPRLTYIFIPKTICFVSLYPFIEQHKQILRQILDYSRKSFIQIPLEKIIMNLVIEVPVPPRGINEVYYYLPNGIDEYLEIEQIKKERKEKEKNDYDKDNNKDNGSHFIKKQSMNQKEEEIKEIRESEEKYTMKLTRSSINKLPSIDFELEELFISLTTDQLITIFTHMILETKTIFFSRDVNKCFNLILGFLYLLYPLKYPFQVASFLSEQNYSLIECISPYILGVNKEFKDSFFKDNHLEIAGSNILIVDIDHQRIKFDSQEKFPTLPKTSLTKLHKDIVELEKIKSKLNFKNKTQCNEFNQFFCQSFFNVIVSITKTYSKFLNEGFFTSHENMQSTSTSVLFKADDFVNSFASCDQPFYQKLVDDSQMFGEFIYKKMIPKDNKEKLEILFLDENIQEQRWSFSAKKESVFINSLEYEHKNKCIVLKPRELNNEETNYFMITENRIKSLNYGQDITLLEDDFIEFQYDLFPMLNDEIFASEKNASDYLIAPSLNYDVESISTDLLAKANLNSFGVQSFEMQNYIYLTWLQLWAFSFSSINVEEHKYRFDQMIEILNKVTHHEIEVFNLLFEALKNQNEEDMILRLYQKLIKYRMNPSSYIYSIISKMIDKQTIQSLISNPDAKFFYNDQTIKPCQFKPRSIKNVLEEEVLMKRVIFYTIYYCADCQQKLDLFKLSTNFSEMKRDVLWAFCEGCSGYILPKLRIRLGKELNIAPKLKEQTSTVDEVVLHSPYYLKLNVKDGLYRAYGLNLDLNQFKMKFTPLFWDSIWYFMLLKIDYKFFWPYEELINPHTKRPSTNFIIKKEQKLIKIKPSFTMIIGSMKPLKGIDNKSNHKKTIRKAFNCPNRKLEKTNVISFTLSSIIIKVVGQCIIDVSSTINESTFQNTNMLDNSLISEANSFISEASISSMDSFCFSPDVSEKYKRHAQVKKITFTQELCDSQLKILDQYPLEIVAEVEGDVDGRNNSFDDIKPICPLLLQEEQIDYQKSQKKNEDKFKEKDSLIKGITISNDHK